MTTVFVDETIILTLTKDRLAATYNLQISIDNIVNWMRRWTIQISSDWSVASVTSQVSLDQTIISQNDLTRDHQVRQKKLQIEE